MFDSNLPEGNKISLRQLLSALFLTIACAPAAHTAEILPYHRSGREGALHRALEALHPDESSEIRYFQSFIDLNGDSRDEAVAHVVGPDVCGSSGCSTYVFSATDTGYQLVCEIGLTRPPIVAAPERTNGWRDLIVFVAGGGILPGYSARLRFDGSRYPENPTVEPAIRVQGKPRGKVLVRRFEVYTEGSIPLRSASRTSG